MKGSIRYASGKESDITGLKVNSGFMNSVISTKLQSAYQGSAVDINIESIASDVADNSRFQEEKVVVALCL